MMSIDINGNAILNVHELDYRCIINRIRKSEAINLLTENLLNADSRGKCGTL